MKKLLLTLTLLLATPAYAQFYTPEDVEESRQARRNQQYQELTDKVNKALAIGDPRIQKKIDLGWYEKIQGNVYRPYDQCVIDVVIEDLQSCGWDAWIHEESVLDKWPFFGSHNETEVYMYIDSGSTVTGVKGNLLHHG